MGDMYDYLSWRGDLSFDADPFNEIDNLLLATLSYTHFDGIVPEDGRVVPLEEARDRFFRTHDRAALKREPSFQAKPPFLMDEMLKSRRFRDLGICSYINRVEADKRLQMSAVSFLPGDGSCYVAFRGTDSTLTGWKEDFDLSYIAETPGQELAIEYLNRVAALQELPLRVGGHSKGGNFAVYSSSFCEPAVQERILTVFNNDGPGFLQDMIQSEEYHRMLPKIHSIIPDTSIIGLLLSSLSQPHVIKSTANGIMQHDCFTWCIQGNRFVEANLSELGKIVDRTLDTMIEETDNEDLKSLAQTFFTILEATGKETVDEISNEKLRSAKKMLSTVPYIPKKKLAEMLRFAAHLLLKARQTAREELPGVLKSGKSLREA